jgi:acyl-CoA synthetase (NDP forming)
MNILGPNCQGMNNCVDNLCASWPLQQKQGNIGIISQSGTVAAKLQSFCVDEEIGFSYSFSMGNRLDLDEGDLIEFLVDDDFTKVIALYIEGAKDGRKLFRAFKRSKKPIIVLKSGRTPKGQRAARFHASSLAGEDRVFDGALSQARCLRVDTVEQLFDACKTLSLLEVLPDNKVIIVTSSGGAGILATDYAEKSGLDVVALTKETENLLASSLPSNCTISNPLDLTGDTTAEGYMKAIEVISEHMQIHTFLLIIGDPIEDTSEMIVHCKANLGVEIIPIYMGGGEAEQTAISELQARQIPIYTDPSRGIFAIYSLYYFGALL